MNEKYWNIVFILAHATITTNICSDSDDEDVLESIAIEHLLNMEGLDITKFNINDIEFEEVTL